MPALFYREKTSKMDWNKLRTYSGKRKTRTNTHCASPVPDMVVPGIVGRRNASRQCLNLISKRQTGSVSAKTLPAIQETSKVDCFSAEQSVEMNYNESTGMNMNENIKNMDSNTSQDSLHLNTGSRESLGNSETSSGMTLPTGVSDFLLECLDSSIEINTESGDGTNSYSSPETFRDGSDLEETCVGPREYFGCKNSTLLDTSRAINIDKISLPSFSKTFENTLEGREEHHTSDKLFKSKQCCESTDVPTTIKGKQVYKILSSKEKTPKSKPSEILTLPPKQNKQLDDQQPRRTKFRKKVHFKSVLESTASSSSSAALSSANSKASAPSHGIIAGELASEEPGANMYLHHPPEICCIIKASPEFRPLKVVQHPLSRRILFPPPGVSTDIITSDINWIYGNDR
ncbi:meiosis-specific kinetochore protein [Heteronotia binoei]|uniref:meiosis-specific kinetochore protein n=1 Tax=Heteronotia binoei TaxID=13085 RepID=UPI00292F28C3|nr:meiosis-specific kinetochore protein [Heteronotia binoei]